MHSQPGIEPGKKLSRLDRLDGFFVRYHNRMALVLGLLALACLAIAFPQITAEDAAGFLPKLR